MKSSAWKLLVCGLAASALLGCSNLDERSNEAVGGAIGGATGAVIGREVGGKNGAVIGAGAGAAVAIGGPAIGPGGGVSPTLLMPRTAQPNTAQ